MSRRIRTILLASVLKPLDDTRMYEKFGRTLAEHPNMRVHVAGRAAPMPPHAPANLHAHILLSGTRLSLARLQAQRRYWQLLQHLQPDLCIVHAPELLPLTLLWRALGHNRRFIYDVRENYALNIKTQRVYPAWLRGLLAAAVRGMETLAARFAARIILAERSYAEELPFARPDRTIVLENKYQPLGQVLTRATPVRLVPGQTLELLYSGTISELNGVFEAIAFTLSLRKVWPEAHLTIIGYAQQQELLLRLQAAIAATHGAVTLVGGATPVPHAQVVAAIGRSQVGLLPYHSHPSSWRCIPTKLFEYLALGLPVAIPNNALWGALVARHQAGIVVDFTDASKAAEVRNQLLSGVFYPAGVPADAFWAAEGAKLWSIVETIE
ncbi:glycosyltransferase [Hymenobacter sp. DG25B]|uniref:glycosyltransferase n=1 Tax=Hymenobacter sp. DG25B TaxID=1385664 RepID=UPI0006620D1C|nr:glycosyltransferase [Hymenobacter sp. DG25B]